MQLSENEIKHNLAAFGGSETLYKNVLFKGVVYTEGVRYIATSCDAYWLVTDLLAYVSSLKIHHDFIVIHLFKQKNENNASLVFEDGNDNAIRPVQKYSFTDFPLNDTTDKKGVTVPAITFFYANNVLYLPNEH